MDCQLQKTQILLCATSSGQCFAEMAQLPGNVPGYPQGGSPRSWRLNTRLGSTLTLGHSWWTRSKLVKQSKVRLDYAQMAVQPCFWSHDQLWPSFTKTRLMSMQNPASLSISWPVTLRLAHVVTCMLSGNSLLKKDDGLGLASERLQPLNSWSTTHPLGT